MDRFRLLNPTFTRVLGIVAGIGMVQLLTILRSPSQPSHSSTLQELYQLRDRLIAQVETPSPSTEPTFLSTFLPQSIPQTTATIQQKLQAVEAQILIEQRANDSWQQAIRLANQAIDANLLSSDPLTIAKQRQLLWQRAIENLQEIPQNSFLAHSTATKIQEYQQNLATATAELQQAKSKVLAQIVQDSGLSDSAMVTVCHLSRDCIHLRGDRPPISPASLIKVPVAVALLHKVTKENISLNEKVYVEPGNFTEDASEITASQNYPLKTLLDNMIDRSSNIATNQLIDYLSLNYINQFLESRGYQTTRVNFKLMGESTMPNNPGQGANRLTSDELTEMMVQIYNHEIPGNQILIQALRNQYDRNLGFAAVQGTTAKWLGEKTGENSLVLGTTLAVSIKGEGYVITIIDNRSGNDPQMRQSIAKIIDYIAKNGEL